MKNNWRLYRKFQNKSKKKQPAKSLILAVHFLQDFPNVCILCLYSRVVVENCNQQWQRLNTYTHTTVLMAWCLCKFLHCNRFIFHLLDWYLFFDSRSMFTFYTLIRVSNGRWNCANKVFHEIVSIAYFRFFCICHTTFFNRSVWASSCSMKKNSMTFLMVEYGKANDAIGIYTVRALHAFWIVFSFVFFSFIIIIIIVHHCFVATFIGK